MNDLVLWYLVATALGLMSLPVVSLVFRWLPDRGWSLARPFGLLVVGWLVWLPLTVTRAPFTSAWILGTMVLWLLANVTLLATRPEVMATLRGLVKSGWRHLVAVEAVFFVAYAVMAWEHSFTPAVSGTEKYMDVAFISSIWRTQTLPPPDPWLSGLPINYYYFGHYLIGMLAKLLGTEPAVAFSIAVALIFALCASTIYGVAANLVAALHGGQLSRGIGPGVISAVATLVLGNLAGAEVWWGQATKLATGAGSTLSNPWQWWLHRELWPGYDWWSPSRVVNPSNTINEFPAFSFVLADLHAHVLALPFAAMGVGFGLNLLLARGQVWEWLHERRGETVLTLVCGGILLGGLFAINGWDLPTYLGLAIFLLAVQQWLAHGKKLDRAFARDLAIAGGSLALAAFVLYLPFYTGYVSPGQGIGLVPGDARSPIGQVMAVFGFPLFLLVSLLVLRIFGGITQNTLRRRGPQVALEQGVILVSLVAVYILLVTFTSSFLLWTFLLAVLLAVLCLRRALFALRDGQNESQRADAAVWTFGAVALVLVGLCEIVYLRDVFAGGSAFRMNTVFKLYFQAWLLLGVSVGPLAVLLRREVSLWLRRLRASEKLALPAYLQRVGSGAMLLWLCLCLGLLLATAIYPVLAVASRTGNLALPRSLNGLDFAATSGVGPGDCSVVGGGIITGDDATAIHWLNTHIAGSPVIAEVSGAEYSLCSRVSAFTGLPTIMGWTGHEDQWRATWLGQGDNAQRFSAQGAAVDTIYTQTDQNTVLATLNMYHVRYVYVGEAERQHYPHADLSRFGQFLRVAYQQGTVTIYEVAGGRS